MKLALVADAFPPLRTSAAVQLRDLAREFLRQGHDLTVFLPDSTLSRRWAEQYVDGVRVVRLKAPRTKDIGYIRRTLGEWAMPFAMRYNLKRSPLSSETWDGVVWYSPSIFHTPFVRTLTRRSGCPNYLIIRDIFPDWAVDLGLMRPGIVYRMFRMIARQQYRVADVIGVQSPGNLSYFEGLSGKDRIIEVLANWLDFPADVTCSIRVDRTPLAGRKIFVYAGNMGVAQDMGSLVDLAAMKRNRTDIGFLFVGRGSEVKRLRDRAEELGLVNVFFHDEIDPDEIPDLYRQCDAGIVALDPRHRSHNIPGKFLTYMQNGLPVFAVVNPGNDLAALVRSEAVGEVCETRDLNELAMRFDNLVSELEVDSRMSDRCKQLFKRDFASHKAVRQIVAALRLQA